MVKEGQILTGGMLKIFFGGRILADHWRKGKGTRGRNAVK